MKKISIAMVMLFVSISMTVFANAAQNTWPKEIPLANGGKIVIYQPQPESLNGVVLSARAAVSIATTADADQTFGSIWFDATLETDKDSRTGTMESMVIKEAKFPAIKDPAQLQQYTSIVENEVPKWDLQFSLDQLLTSVQQSTELNEPNLKNDAPNVIYRDRASTLVVLDGQPKLQLDNQSGMQKVVNTPSTIVLNPDDNLYYLYGGGLWYSSRNVLNGWTYTPNLPVRIQQLDEQIQQQVAKDAEANGNQDKPSTPTDIIVSTVPAELIQTEGAPSYQTVEGTNLLYVDNSLNDIFKDINTQQNYILISGRWYTSSSLLGGWSYVPSNQLPADFAKIPEGTEKDGVLSSVAGTKAANEALMDAQIPQTAKVDRKTATTTVTYDGSPIFKQIEGTNLSVAENSSITVLRSNVNGMYYAVDNGIWYISNTPDGPWQVSTDRPSDVNNIPANNIAYNTKYVYVYDYSDDYVYTGYTPGYLGCYVYGSTVVWGTGWHYHPWYRHYYYPRPYTWGFGMAYNPWTGWSIGYVSGYSLGWHYSDYNVYAHGWFGPRAYHPAYRPWGYNGGFYGRSTRIINQPRIVVNRPVYVNMNTTHHDIRNVYVDNNHSINLYNRVQGARTIDVNRRQGAAIGGNTELRQPNRNLGNNQPASAHPQGNNNYNAPFNKPNTPAINPTMTEQNRSDINNNGRNNRPFTPGNNAGTQTPQQRPQWNNNVNHPLAAPSNTDNNIATDRQGNVYKIDNNGSIQQRTPDRTWQPTPPAKTPTEVNNVQQQRDRGNVRAENFTRVAPPLQPQRMQPQPQRPQSAPQQRQGGNGEDKHRPR